MASENAVTDSERSQSLDDLGRMLANALDLADALDLDLVAIHIDHAINLCREED